MEMSPGPHSAGMGPRLPQNIDQLKGWWDDFAAKYSYPLYAIMLASEADSEAANFFQNHLRELSDLSGEDCCFIYFRDLDRANRLEPFVYSEHAKWLYQLTKLLGIDNDELPCIVFCERIDSGNYLYMNLAGMNS
jgi:hypothetical protein